MAKAQPNIELVEKNGTNPHFSSKYATLDEIWKRNRRHINEAGMVVYCTVEANDTTRTILHRIEIDDKLTAELADVLFRELKSHTGTKELVTHLAEVTSGEEIACAFPIIASGNSPQAIGSAMTYARRYTLNALLEIVAGEDDDGEAAERPMEARQRAMEARTASRAKPAPKPATTATPAKPSAGDGFTALGF